MKLITCSFILFLPIKFANFQSISDQYSNNELRFSDSESFHDEVGPEEKCEFVNADEK